MVTAAKIEVVSASGLVLPEVLFDMYQVNELHSLVPPVILAVPVRGIPAIPLTSAGLEVLDIILGFFYGAEIPDAYFSTLDTFPHLKRSDIIYLFDFVPHIPYLLLIASSDWTLSSDRPEAVSASLLLGPDDVQAVLNVSHCDKAAGAGDDGRLP